MKWFSVDAFYNTSLQCHCCSILHYISASVLCSIKYDLHHWRVFRTENCSFGFLVIMTSCVFSVLLQERKQVFASGFR